MEQRGHRFVRYADDCNIYVRSRRAGERVLNSVQRFLEDQLSLTLNLRKSAVDRPWKWHMAASPVVHMALSNAYWQAQGLCGITERYHQLRSA